MPPASTHAFAPTLPEGLGDLAALALDLRWTWTYAAEELWARLGPDVWALTRNPWVILQTTPRGKLEALARHPGFLEALREQVRAHAEALDAPGWFQAAHPNPPLTSVAYFSMEFGLSDALPIYSGGLGVLAGDHLKAASDLGVPLAAVGLLYDRGYFRQVLDAEGAQIELYPSNERSQLPVVPLRRPDGGEWLRLKTRLPGRDLWLRAWEARVGRVRLYLLDSNDPLNVPADRGITGELYGGGPELRLQQELVLGLVGWRLLRTLGLAPEVCHLNEGHAAFALLERAREVTEAQGCSFREALAATRAGNVFTTHTPIAAGFDRFPPAMIERYMRNYLVRLGIGLDDLMALGRANPDDPHEPLNMAYLAIRGSGAVNGVSRLHGEVSRRLFQPLFPSWPEIEVPVGHVTNGVHTPSWSSAEVDRLLSTEDPAGRPSAALDDEAALARALDGIPDARLWEHRGRLRAQLIAFVRARFARQRGAEGAPLDEIAEAAEALDPNVLTLGFARRFATYKRPNLLLHDPERLVRLLTDARRPVQLVLAGKAHPHDAAGKAMVQAWVRFSRRPDARRHVVFLGDYDMMLTEHMVQGVDVWLNTPRRPWEASGTSGMKVLVNGGLNLSVLDGWWAEAYAPEVGWALGDGREHHDDPAAWDAREAEALFALLEREVVPAFYGGRDERGVPTAWVARVRESMRRLTPRFSAGRMVREYTGRYYLPAAAANRDRRQEAGQRRPGAELEAWRSHLAAYWGEIRFGELRVETADDGRRHRFQAHVYFGELDPDAVAVELYADPLDSGDGRPVREAMRRGGRLEGAVHGYAYTAEVPADRPSGHYTPRVIPHHPLASVPLEAAQILWYR